ncbi:HEAT repeat domain-containing protein [Nocardiopsis sp. L17-MgMaSL7]|uniref:HEAT repeat domain-containing protein n=1 Tax=Nocardiopsis sp. L17-MgMaSL7 TaxID=1938893 RepID=UPI000D71BB0A|nr:HEAT repeat domain-containing protein [Nocardiopsis sp. L17-MgMaSL7]PWV57165.1 HEAT repeat protein [Nocardiopsis sp. L17-MgMaSL7]
MAMFVHLTPRANISRIRRSGLGTAIGPGGLRGVFCFPVLPSYTVTHQWLRELTGHHGPRGLIAVYLTLADDEPVTVGHFDDSDGPQRVGAAEAVRVVAGLREPRGWEVFVPRRVDRHEVHRIREVRRLAETRPLPRSGPVPMELVADACDRADTVALREALSLLGRRRRGPIDRVASLCGHPEPLVRATLAESIVPWAVPGVDDLLTRLSGDPDHKVREAAVQALETRAAVPVPRPRGIRTASPSVPEGALPHPRGALFHPRTRH